MRWPAGCTNRPVRVVDPSDRLLLFDAPASVRAGRLQAEARNRPAGQKAGGAAWIESWHWRHAALLEWRRANRRLVSRLTMSRWQIHDLPAATEAARRFCRD